MASESDPFAPPYGKPGFDIHGDQRGRIVGTCVAIIIITTTFVFFRLLSRKLSKAGFWVSVGVPVLDAGKSLLMGILLLSGTITLLYLHWYSHA